MIDIAMFRRFITFDRAFQVRVLIVILFLGVIRWEFQIGAQQARQVKRFSAEQALIARIPEMQARLVAMTTAPVSEVPKHEVKPDRGFHLEGVLLEKDDHAALVNGEVRKIGDVVGPFEIVQITSEGVAVADRSTGTIEVIPLSRRAPAAQ